MPVYYDIALATTHQYFSSRVMEFCAEFDLSFYLVEPIWVADYLSKVQEGEIKTRVYIDFGSDHLEPNNLYFALAEEVKKSGAYMIDDPDHVATVAHKGLFHQVLLENEIAVPETVIVQRADLNSFRLNDDIKAYVGVPFVVKPGWGGGRWGVVLDGRSEEDLYKSAREADFSDSFLIQKKIVPKPMDGRVGWFRVFHIFEETIICWWDPQTGQYQLVTPLEKRTYDLRPLEKIADDIARLSQINFFSTEIALTCDNRFLVIDYLNTGCDMHAKSFWPTGPPDEVVRHIAWNLVDHAMAIARRRRGPFDDELEQKDRDKEWGERQRQGLPEPGA